MADSFQLADGYISIKADTAAYDKALDEQRKKLEDFNKQLNTGVWERSQRQAFKLSQEFARANKEAQKIVDTIKYGRIGGALQRGARGLDAFRGMVAGPGAIGFGAGAAAVGMASSASPLAADTLSKSFQLLTATIGKDFLPLLMDVSVTLQNMATWWKRLDSGLKDTITTTAKFIGITGGVALALSAVTKGLSVLMKHPLLVALGAAGALAIEGNDALGERVQKAQDANLAMKLNEVANDKRMRMLMAMPHEDAVKSAKGDMHDAWNNYERLRKNFTDFQNDPIRRGLSSIHSLLGGGENTLENKLFKATSDAQRELEKSKLRLSRLGQDMGPGQGGNALAAIMGGIEGGSGRIGGNRTKLGSAGPASFIGAGELLKSIMQAAAGSSEIDAEILKEQQINNVLTREIRDAINAGGVIVK